MAPYSMDLRTRVVRAWDAGLEPVMKLCLYCAREFGTRRDGQSHPASAFHELSE